jgi:glycosyltransferase involved in cell wall biosynthesis
MLPPLYIPFKNKEQIGGPVRFKENLKKYLDNSGIRYLKDPSKALMLFFPVSMPENTIKDAKERGGKIIQRLDGVYYPSKHGNQHMEFNKPIKIIYENYADFVVFQSEYSRRQCFSVLGEKTEEEYSIIMNGVDKRIFYPATDAMAIKKSVKVRLVTSGNFRNRDMLETIIKALDLMIDSYDLELLVLGPVTNKELNCFLKRKYVVHKISRDIKQVADILRQKHIFIYSHLNPPCPNSVIEAISCGLPVVGFDSGSMRELLPFGIDLLAWVSNDLFQKYDDFKFEKLAEKIAIAIDNYEIVKDRAMAHSHLYSFDECGEKYVSLFSRILQAQDKNNIGEDHLRSVLVAGMNRR